MSNPSLVKFTVKAAEGGRATLSPSGTKYEVPVDAASAMGVGSVVEGVIRLKGRKVWTIPAGGSFVSPLQGQPRVVQGKVRHVEAGRIIVHAGYPVSIDIAAGSSSLDLKNGPLQPGVMVNVTVWPGASFEAA